MASFITPRKLRQICRVSALVLAGALSSHADELFNDTFTTGSLNANGWYFYGNSGTTAWAAVSAPAGSTLLSGTTMRRQLGTTQSNVVAIKPFTAFTFNAIGDSISVSLDFRAQGTEGALMVGFFNAPAISSNQLAGGYSSGSTGFQLWKGYSANSAARYRNGGGTNIGDSLAASTVGNNVDHTLTFTLTLTSDGLQLSGSVAGTALATYTDSSITAGTGYSVNALRLHNNSASTTYFDNIVVTTTAIPEVGTAWLGVATGCFALFSAGRHRRVRGKSAS